jgi:hypothetical protein
MDSTGHAIMKSPSHAFIVLFSKLLNILTKLRTYFIFQNLYPRITSTYRITYPYCYSTHINSCGRNVTNVYYTELEKFCDAVAPNGLPYT